MSPRFLPILVAIPVLVSLASTPGALAQEGDGDEQTGLTLGDSGAGDWRWLVEEEEMAEDPLELSEEARSPESFPPERFEIPEEPDWSLDGTLFDLYGADYLPDPPPESGSNVPDWCYEWFYQDEPERWTGVRPAPHLECYLVYNLDVASAINWEHPDGSFTNYLGWDDWRKEQLQDMFLTLWQWFEEGMPTIAPLGLPGVPVNKVAAQLGPTDKAFTVLHEAQAWEFYLAQIATSLVVEIGGWVPWSLKGYHPLDRRIILDAREMYQWDPDHLGYRIPFYVAGRGTPSPPPRLVKRMWDMQLVASTTHETISRLLHWSRGHLNHGAGDNSVLNSQQHWQYAGYAPLYRILDGTISTHPDTSGLFSHWTLGCHATAGFYRGILRLLNIPVERLQLLGHAAIRFPHLDLYLPHGDTPYWLFVKSLPPFPAHELLIDGSEWTNMFGAGASQAERERNIGLFSARLGVKYLDKKLLGLHCVDLYTGNSPWESKVYKALQGYFAVFDLVGMGLWERLDVRLADLGGCQALPALGDQYYPWPTPPSFLNNMNMSASLVTIPDP